MTKNFSETGFIIVRNAISKNLVKKIQNEIYSVLKIRDSKKVKRYKKFCNLVKNLKNNEYNFTKPIFETLHFKGLLEKMFLEKKFYKTVVDLMGKDLAFCTDTGITLNLPNKPSPKKLSLKIGTKKFGQELILQLSKYGLH